MAKRDENKVIKQMILSGDIKQFQDIFRYAKVTPLVEHLKTNHSRLQTLIADVTKFRISTLVSIAEYFELDEKTMLDLIANQLIANKRKRKS